MQKVAIILPCYNESTDLIEKIAVLKNHILENNTSYEFFVIAVNDGSKDDTYEIAKSIEGVVALTYEPNHGKGYAVRFGMAYALNELQCDYVCFMDLDLSTDLKDLIPMLDLLSENDIVIGSRYDKDSLIANKQPLKRRFVSKCSRIIIKTMFHLKLKDTQCGFKAFNRKAAEILVNKSKIDRFAFDVEYLYIAKLNKLKYASIPVVWRDEAGSSVKVVNASITFFKDLFVIKKNKKHYFI